MTKDDIWDFAAVAALLTEPPRQGVLGNAFDWAMTPQGWGFWQEQNHRLAHGRALTDDAVAALRDIAAIQLGINTAVAPEPKEQIAAPAKEGALPVRALRFGQPQIMGGTGQWDNVRYAENDAGDTLYDPERD